MLGAVLVLVLGAGCRCWYVSWLCTPWRQVAGAVLVLGARCRCWCCELAVHVVETGCWCAQPAHSNSTSAGTCTANPAPGQQRKPVTLGQPRLPSLKEPEIHFVTHIPYAPWCQACVATKRINMKLRTINQTSERTSFSSTSSSPRPVKRPGRRKHQWIK